MGNILKTYKIISVEVRFTPCGTNRQKPPQFYMNIVNVTCSNTIHANTNLTKQIWCQKTLNQKLISLASIIMSSNRGQRQALPQHLWRNLKQTNKESWKFIYLLLQQDTNILRCAFPRALPRGLAINKRKPTYKQTHDLKNEKNTASGKRRSILIRVSLI